MNKKGPIITVSSLLILFFMAINICPQVIEEPRGTPLQPVYKKEQLIVLLIRRIPIHIEWPEPVKFDNNLKHFVIGVFADPEFHEYFNDMFSRNKIKNKPVTIKPIITKKDLEGIHMLFLCKKNEQDFSHITQWVEDKPILIVSYSPEITPAGIHVNISKRYAKSSNQGQFKLQINIARIKKSGFRTSNYMLRGSSIEIVNDKPKEEDN